MVASKQINKHFDWIKKWLFLRFMTYLAGPSEDCAVSLGGSERIVKI